MHTLLASHCSAACKKDKLSGKIKSTIGPCLSMHYQRVLGEHKVKELLEVQLITMRATVGY